MGMRFHPRKADAQPIAVTTRTGVDAGWSIGTWTGQTALPPAPETTSDDDEVGGD